MPGFNVLWYISSLKCRYCTNKEGTRILFHLEPYLFWKSPVQNTNSNRNHGVQIANDISLSVHIFSYCIRIDHVEITSSPMSVLGQALAFICGKACHFTRHYFLFFLCIHLQPYIDILKTYVRTWAVRTQIHFILRENMENYKILVIKGGLKSDKVETNYSNFPKFILLSHWGRCP